MIGWLMMGFGGFAFLIASFQLFFFLFVLSDNFVEEMILPQSDLFIEQYLNFIFTNLPFLLGFF
ncbi:MAG: hypothetical protein AAFN10_29010, partial [Bacteroidota bacterium]